MKGYVINEINWEYNDQTYDARGVVPVKVYRDKARAETECRKLNVDWIGSMAEDCSFLLFGADLDDGHRSFARGWDKTKFIALVKKLGGSGSEIWDMKLPGTLDVSEIEQVMQAVTSRGYEVSEVDIDG